MLARPDVVARSASPRRKTRQRGRRSDGQRSGAAQLARPGRIQRGRRIETEPTMSGWSRISTVTGHEEFPHRPGDHHTGARRRGRVLLARQPSWPGAPILRARRLRRSRRSLESCVVREIREEVGARRARRPIPGRSAVWPFPRSVMLGFAAVADPEPFEFQDGEIAEAAWFTRDQVLAALEVGTGGRRGCAVVAARVDLDHRAACSGTVVLAR